VSIQRTLCLGWLLFIVAWLTLRDGLAAKEVPSGQLTQPLFRST